MAKTHSSVIVPCSPEEAFERLTDLARFDEWMVVHDSWQGEAPVREALRPGLQVTSVLAVKGSTAPFDWTIDEYAPPSTFRCSGKEKGVKAAIELSVAPVAGGAEATFQLELGGLPMVGPVGKAAVNSLRGEVVESMERFQALFGA